MLDKYICTHYLNVIPILREYVQIVGNLTERGEYSDNEQRNFNGNE